MTKRLTIRAVDGVDDQGPASEPTLHTEMDGHPVGAGDDVPWLHEDAYPAPPKSWGTTALRFAAVLVVLAWSGVFIWAYREAFTAATSPALWTSLFSTWVSPVVLVVGLWLLAQRNSTREAERYGAVAQLLEREAAALESRMVAVNRELSLAREFLGAQSRELDFLGRSAAERIAEHAAALEALIHENSRQVETIAGVSVTALDNMNRLRDQLPVVANSARDVTNQIGAAARTAQGGLAELVAGFERLNEFGSASEHQVTSLRGRIDDALVAFTEQADHLQTLADERFAALRADSEAFRSELDSREVDALAAVQARAEKLRLALVEAQAQSDEAHRTSAAALEQRLADLSEEAGKVTAALRDGEQVAAGLWRGQIEAISADLRQAVDDLAKLDQQALDSAQAKLRALVAEAEGVDARLTERNRRFDLELAQRRDVIDALESEAIDKTAGRLSELDSAITHRRAEQAERIADFDRQVDALSDKMREFGEAFERAAGQGLEAQTATAGAVDALAGKLTETREALDGTDMAVAALTDSSVRLLELIQASAKHSRDDLPAAMSLSESKLLDIEARSATLQATMQDIAATGDGLLAALEKTAALGEAATPDVAALRERLGELASFQRETLATLRGDLAGFASEAETTANLGQEELKGALASLQESTNTALTAIEAGQAERVKAIAADISEQSRTALSQALAEETRGVLAELESAAQRAGESGRATVIQLRDQLARVNELAGNIETRVAQARERAEEQVDNDFSRRVALITESLNSNAIDIAKALSSEVTDTAWASYLRGDRGVFTRRAVRLLDNTEAREVAQLYDADHEFREHVSRFIHDFEAMLRTILSTRDGHAVSVTLLSSDMGKLYVALAQALERLRQ